MANEFYDVTYGSVRLWCESVQSDNSRTIVKHELAEGDDHPTQDKGKTPGTPTTCAILWIEMPSETLGPKERFLKFKQLVDAGDGPHLFVHPIDGAYYAHAENFVYRIDEDDNIVDCSVTFIRAAAAEEPTPVGSGTSVRAGEAAVADKAAKLAEILGELEVDSDVPAAAVAAQESWQDADEVPTRQVINDVAGLSDSLNALIVDEGLEDDIELWPAFKATIELGAAVRAAALAALAETPKLTAILIAEPIALLALCVRLYGGGEAEDRVREILALNDIRTPGWIAAGSLIMVPVPSSSRRARRAA